jgi:hypothetical protein
MLVLLAAFVARGRARRGRRGAGPARGRADPRAAADGPTLVLLGNPDHVGTAVPVLLLLLLLLLLLDW